MADRQGFAGGAGLITAVLALGLLLAAYAAPGRFPTWAFPAANSKPPTAGWSQTRLLHLPGSSLAFTEARTRDPLAPPDWFPQRHQPAPAIILTGRSEALRPCGYCHLPDGSGRPENAALAGLPAAYIRQQVAAFRSGARRGAVADWGPSSGMAEVAAHATDAQTAAAAAYFASIRFKGHVRVVETARISGAVAKGYLLMPVPGHGEPLGQRIVEGPSSFERFERRDPTLIYTAYAPPGSLARGAELARNGAGGAPCVSCHGAGLKGGEIGPPLAGRSPSYLFRQLYGFQTGARTDPQAAPMRQLAGRLSQADMIALAAYAASRTP